MEDRAEFVHADQKNMTLEDEVAAFIALCAKRAAEPCTPETSSEFRALQEDEVKLRKRIEKTHEAEKAPHLAAGRVVDAKYLPHIPKLKEAIKAVTDALTKFMDAERAKAEAARLEAKRLADEEAARAAKLAKEAETADDPFAAFDKSEEARKVEAEAVALHRQAAAPVKVNVASASGGRAAALRTVGWIPQITDQAAFAAHYAEYDEVLELMKTIAKREAKASKGRIKVPGCTFIEDRRAA